MTKPVRLLLRADGNTHIGLGHVMRLLALAAILRQEFIECLFVTQDTSMLGSLLSEAGLVVEAVPTLTPTAEAAWLREHLLRPTDVLVLDGYEFGFDYQLAVRQSVGRLVYVDDLRAWPVVADVLINHSPGITATMYERLDPSAVLLLGPAFSLLRPAFLAALAPPRAVGPIRKVLLCFGGADPLHLTARCLPLLLNEHALHEVGILVGPANSDGAVLRQQIALQRGSQRVLHEPADADTLVAMLHYYDAIVCPASTILIEALLVGIPALTGYYADNQRHLADFVHAQGQAYSAGNFTELTDDQLLAHLQQGLRKLGNDQRQPYVNRLQPDILRTSITAPLRASHR